MFLRLCPNPRRAPRIGRLLALLGLVAPLGLPAQTKAGDYAISTFAGRSSVGAEDGPGATARFYSPGGLAIDSHDNLYVADTFNHTLRRIDPSGTVSTFAGHRGQNASLDGPLASAEFAKPVGLAIDGADAVYVAEAGTGAVRKIVADQVSTLGSVQNLILPYGPAAFSMYGEFLAAVAVDRGGNVYAKTTMNASTGLARVFKLTPAGAIQTFAIVSPPRVSFGEFTFGLPSVGVDAQGNILSVDNYWLMITLPDHVPENGGNGWMVSTLNAAGNTVATSTANHHPVASSDPTGVTFLADVDAYTQPGTLTVTAAAIDGTVSSVSSAAQIDPTWFPISGVVRNHAGDYFFLGESAVFRMTAAGAVSVVAGTPVNASSVQLDGTGASARFTGPSALAIDPAGNLYVADGSLRRITPAGVVTTLLGPLNPNQPHGRPAVLGEIDPTLLAVDGSGNAYIRGALSATQPPAILRLAPDGTITTTFDNSSGILPTWQQIYGLAADQAGNVFIASFQAVYKIAPSGETTLFAGLTGVGQWGYADGPGASAQFKFITGLAVDHSNNLLVADFGNNRVRRIAPDGTVSTISEGSQPTSIAADLDGNVFVASRDNTLRKISPLGVMTTLAGAANVSDNADGVGSAARFLEMGGIAVDGNGNLYVADSSNNTIRKGQLAGAPVITAQPRGGSAVIGGAMQFAVTATGVPAPTYQWYLNGNVLPGATGPSLALAGIQAANAGDYTVVVSNAVGSVTSSPATLTVAAPAETAAPSGGGGAIDAALVLALCLLGVIRQFFPTRR